MIVHRDDLARVAAAIAAAPERACDTETTGLDAYGADVPFAVIVAVPGQVFYFNMNQYPDLLDGDERLLTAEEVRACAFATPASWAFHNAKFDLTMLAKLGVYPLGDIFDTKLMARLHRNDEYAYGLDDLARRYLDKVKDDGVRAWLLKNKQAKGMFQLVPLAIIVPYAEHDAALTLELKAYLAKALAELETTHGLPHLPKLSELQRDERELLHVVAKMETDGVLIDRPFCLDAKRHERMTDEIARAEFQALTGKEFTASPKLLADVLAGEPIHARTPTGRPCYDADALKLYDHPAARLVLKIRGTKSKLDIYDTFLHKSAHDGAIHATFDQAGTTTGRFSSSGPNLQNLKKERDLKDVAYTPRRAIVPRNGHFFAMFDMDQAEYRLMLDYAGAKKLIDLVLGGLDVHQATAALAQITRQEAKTANFAILYGAGDDTLAEQTKRSPAAAARLRESIFRAGPEIERFIDTVKRTARMRGFVVNWAGRIIRCSNPRFCYATTNHLIQGGVGDIVKRGMLRTSEFLAKRKLRTKLVLNIHDELVFEVPRVEAEILPEIRAILEGIYPHKFLPLTWGVDHSFKSLADKVEGLPDVA